MYNEAEVAMENRAVSSLPSTTTLTHKKNEFTLNYVGEGGGTKISMNDNCVKDGEEGGREKDTGRHRELN